SPYYSGDTDGHEGTFVWGDSTNGDFISTGPNQFLIRASGGVGIGTPSPEQALDVRGVILAQPGSSGNHDNLMMKKTGMQADGTFCYYGKPTIARKTHP
ncbi:MAG: hypothetical protein AABZ64_01150, partial [Nitrospinota bacterium]